MRLIRSAAIISILCVITLLCGCQGGFFGLWADVEETPSPTPSPSPEYTPAFPKYVKNEVFGLPWHSVSVIDPFTETESVNIELYRLVYDGLFEVGPDFEPLPRLCESIRRNGTVATITLKSGIQFHDGGELEAADVIYSLQRAKLPQSRFAPRLSAVSSYRALDRMTVEIKLSKPQGRLEALLDFPVVRSGTISEAGPPPGTGPYMLIFSDEERYLKYFPGRGGEMPIERIEVIAQAGTDSLIYDFESGVVDIVSADETTTEPVTYRGELERREYPTTVMQYLVFNTRKAWLSDPGFRLAVSRAVNRAEIAGEIFFGRADAAELPVPPSSPLYDKAAARKLAYDPEQGKILLAGMGFDDQDGDGVLDYSSGKRRFKPLVVNITVNQENPYKVKAAESIAKNLSGLGISCEVVKLKWDQYVKALQSGDFQIAYAEVRLPCDFSPGFLLSRGSAQNYGGYRDGNMDLLIEAFEASEASMAKSAASLMYGRMAGEAPIAPVLFKRLTAFTHWGQVRGINPAQDFLYYEFGKITSEKG